MMDGFVQLGLVGYVVRMVVEFIDGIYNPADKRVTRAIVVAVSAVFVYWLGVDPVKIVKVGIAGAPVAKLAGVALLAGAAMGTNDFAKALAQWGNVKR